MKGRASLLFIDCSLDKKLCKKLKFSTDTFELKHYQDGKFHKLYDRKLTVKSLINFLRDPAGEIPWEEEVTGADVVHIDTRPELMKLLKTERRPLLVMFYAPWCGFCKKLKPEFSAAASDLKSDAVLVGIDVDRPENSYARTEYNITGFPTLVYFVQGRVKYNYGGESNREGIVKWIQNPSPPKEPEREEQWSDTETDVVHLTDASFDQFIATQSSVLVMFYAPWCGHCKHMKPEYVSAAATLKADGVEGVLAAVDATKERKVGERFKIKGYPSVKYFKDGVEAWEYNDRTADKIVEFMKDPREPPPPPPEEASWESTPSAVEHLTDDSFKPFTKKKKHTLVMFYAPWCGHCKKAKPEFTNAADKFKDDSKLAFAAVDCTKQMALCAANDVSGYPTFKYFNYGKNDQKYTGGREEADFVAFMRDPLNPLSSMPALADPAKNWADIPGQENIVHLSEANFDAILTQKPSALVMFYAPWCGHCTAMKPAFAEAATSIKADPNLVGSVLAAVDATVEISLARRFGAKGYPTIKYFKNGVDQFNYEGERSFDALLSFMKNPVQKAVPPAPPRWADEPNSVHHLSPDNFNSFISERPAVLVMFYAPWCGHCTAAKPGYAAAAEQLKGSKDAYMAALDCVESPKICESVGVTSYPTFKTFRSAQSLGDYPGARNTDGYIQYLKTLTSPVAPPSTAGAHESTKQEL